MKEFEKYLNLLKQVNRIIKAESAKVEAYTTTWMFEVKDCNIQPLNRDVAITITYVRNNKHDSAQTKSPEEFDLSDLRFYLQNIDGVGRVQIATDDDYQFTILLSTTYEF